MNYFFDSIMSDIVFDLRKNSKKLCIIGIMFVVCFVFAWFFASRANFSTRGFYYIMTGLVTKKLRSFGFFILSLLSVGLWIALLLFLSFDERIFKCWPLFFSLRTFIRGYDLVLVFRFYFLSAFLSAFVFIIIDLMIFAMFVVMYLDIVEKSINFVRGENIVLLKSVVYPILILIIVATCLQSIIVPLFIL